MIEPSVARRTITSPDYNYNKFTPGHPLANTPSRPNTVPVIKI